MRVIPSRADGEGSRKTLYGYKGYIVKIGQLSLLIF